MEAGQDCNHAKAITCHLGGLIGGLDIDVEELASGEGTYVKETPLFSCVEGCKADEMAKFKWLK
jgi:hypothetical protein